MDPISIARSILPALLVLFAPGGALLAWLSGRPGRRDLLSTLADVLALSVSIPAILALALFMVGVQVGAGGVFGFYILCLLILAVGLAWHHRQIFRPAAPTASVASTAPAAWGLLGLLLLAGLVAWRFYQARGLPLPPWVDSVHHTLIVRKMLEYGGVPPDLNPYLPIQFYYHYGFHLMAVLFASLSGLTPDQAVLWLGQALNAAVCLSVYRAAEAFGQQRGLERPWLIPPAGWAAVAAALLVGFGYQMPAYYLTWGRFPLLTGLALLGPAIAAALDVWDEPANWAAWVRLALLFSGLALTHYFALLLAALFMVVLGLAGLLKGIRNRAYWGIVARLAAFSLLGLFIVSPWMVRVSLYNRETPSVQVVDPLDASASAQKSASDYLQYLENLLGPRRSLILLGAAGVGLLATLRRGRLRLLAAWAVLLGLFALPWGLRFSPFRPDHFAIILFFPAALLLADLLAFVSSLLGRVTRLWVGEAVLAAVMLGLVIWGGRETRDILNPVTVFVVPADMPALNWIQQNVPPDARFYINSTPWQAGMYRGVDGSSWLLPYTGRESLVPPVLYNWGTPEEIKQINGWAERAAQLQGCTPEFWSLVRDAHLTHVYLRQGVGNLQPAMLANCPRLQTIYEQEGVFIYAIRPGQ